MDLLSSTTIQFRPPAESTGGSREPGIYTTVANESYIAVSFSDSSIHILSAQTGSLVLKQPFYQANATLIGGIVFDGDSLIFSLCDSPDLTLFDIPSETVLHTVTCPDDQWIQYLVAAQNDADGGVVVVAHSDGSICVWEMRTRQHIWTMKVHDEYLGRCVVSGAQVITSSSDGTFAVSNWQTGQIEWKKRLGLPMRLVDGKWAGGFGTAFTVWDGKVAVGTNGGRLLILDLNTGEQIAEWQASDNLFQQISILIDPQSCLNNLWRPKGRREVYDRRIVSGWDDINCWLRLNSSLRIGSSTLQQWSQLNSKTNRLKYLLHGSDVFFSNEEFERCIETIQKALQSQMCLIVTQTGLIGMAPSTAQIGDWLCYIKGLDIPVILREKEMALNSTAQEYLVIGGAYAHMDGRLPGSGGFGAWAETYFMKTAGLQSIVLG